MNIYRESGRFYYNNNRVRVEDLLPNTIYYVFDGFNQDASNPQYFIDGRDGHVNNATVYPIDKLDFSFKVTGTKDNQTIDFNGLGNTTGRYEALRELSDVKDLYAGNGIIIDMLY
jgi:hypothetical protein